MNSENQDSNNAAQPSAIPSAETGNIKLSTALAIPDTVDIGAGRHSGLREAAEHLREEARDYSTRAARLRSDPNGSDAALNFAEQYSACANTLRCCADELESRCPITQSRASASALATSVPDQGSSQPSPDISAQALATAKQEGFIEGVKAVIGIAEMNAIFDASGMAKRIVASSRALIPAPQESGDTLPEKNLG